jgi:hypothetical protein
MIVIESKSLNCLKQQFQPSISRVNMRFMSRVVLLLFLSFKITKINGNQQKTDLSTASIVFIIEAFSECKVVNLLSLENPDDSSLKQFKTIFLHFIFKSLKFTFQQESLNYSLKRPNEVQKRCPIIIIYSFEDFLEINQIITPKNFKPIGKFLIISLGGEFSGFEEIFKLLWQKQIYNVNIMFEDKSLGIILVKTFMPFSNGSCSNTKPVLINEFKDGKFSSEDFYLEKMANLQKCRVNGAVTNSSQIFSIINSKNPHETPKGKDVNIMESLSNTLNFKINFTFIGDIGYLYANGSAKGPYRALLDRRSDIFFASALLSVTRLKFVDCTTAFFESSINFAVPPGRDFTSFEKLI